MHRLKWPLIAAVLMILLTGCSQPKQTGKLQVVATVDFYGEVAKAVLGDRGQVTSVIDSPDVDPHDYEPTTDVAKKVADADVIVANGLGYDSWMNNVVSAGNKQKAYLKVGEDLLHKPDGANEHLWYAPSTMPKLADKLAQRFGKLDPKHKADYQKNANAYKQKLTVLTAKIDQLRQNRGSKKWVDVSEPVFDYSLQAMGYQVHNRAFSMAIEDGTDPSPKSVARMKKDIQNRRIAFLVENTQADSRVINEFVALAKKSRVPVLKVTETLPAKQTYISWMLSQYEDLAKIQKAQAVK